MTIPTFAYYRIVTEGIGLKPEFAPEALSLQYKSRQTENELVIVKNGKKLSGYGSSENLLQFLETSSTQSTETESTRASIETVDADNFAGSGDRDSQTFSDSHTFSETNRGDIHRIVSKFKSELASKANVIDIDSEINGRVDGGRMQTLQISAERNPVNPLRMLPLPPQPPRLSSEFNLTVCDPFNELSSEPSVETFFHSNNFANNNNFVPSTSVVATARQPSSRDFALDQLLMLLAVVWVDFNTWGLLSSFVPFALANSTNSAEESSVALSYATQLAAVFLVLGDVSTFFLKLPIPLCVLLTTIMIFTLYAAAYGFAVFDGMSWVLVLCFAFVRFFEAHITTSVFNSISGDFPADLREDAVKFIGLCDMVSIVVGCTIATLFVDATESC